MGSSWAPSHPNSWAGGLRYVWGGAGADSRRNFGESVEKQGEYSGNGWRGRVRSEGHVEERYQSRLCEAAMEVRMRKS
eukprot:3828635-Pleurochrysis_carterae.AAC.1